MSTEQKLAMKIAKAIGLKVRIQKAVPSGSMWVIHNGKKGYAFGAFYVDGEHPLLGTDRFYGLFDECWQTADSKSSPTPEIPKSIRGAMTVEEAELRLAVDGFDYEEVDKEI